MNDCIKIFRPYDSEYDKLKFAASCISGATDLDVKVEDTYFDFGQDWKWTTLIAYKKDGQSFQLLSPRAQKLSLDMM